MPTTREIYERAIRTYFKQTDKFEKGDSLKNTKFNKKYLDTWASEYTKEQEKDDK